MYVLFLLNFTSFFCLEKGWLILVLWLLHSCLEIFMMRRSFTLKWGKRSNYCMFSFDQILSIFERIHYYSHTQDVFFPIASMCASCVKSVIAYYRNKYHRQLDTQNTWSKLKTFSWGLIYNIVRYRHFIPYILQHEVYNMPLWNCDPSIKWLHTNQAIP